MIQVKRLDGGWIMKIAIPSGKTSLLSPEGTNKNFASQDKAWEYYRVQTNQINN